MKNKLKPLNANGSAIKDDKDYIDIDELINQEYQHTGPAYIVKSPVVTVSFRLSKSKEDDIAVERILDMWAETSEKTKNIKKSIGMYHAAMRRDITWFEDNADWLVADIQLAGRIEMQKQLDAQKQQIDDMNNKINEQDAIIKKMIEGMKHLYKQANQYKIIASQPAPEMITDGK